jgi:endoglucanase
MKKKHLGLLKEMIHSCGLSGYNEESSAIFLREAQKLNLICGLDSLGSAAAKIPASDVRFTHYKAKNILICSHHDTHGHLVHSINGDGTFNLRTASLETCEGKEGIIRADGGILPIKFFDVDEEEGTAKAKPINKDLDYSIIKEGDVVTLKPWLEEKIRGKLSGTFLDNKVGCLITTVLMEELVKIEYIPHNVFIVHTSFEETGDSWGARAAVEKIKPYFVINVDMGPVESKSQLGKGPLIYIGPRFNKILTNMAIQLCNDLKIPYVTEVCAEEASSDLDVIPPLNGGTPVCEISFPGMNYHEYEEHVSKKDIYRIVKLLIAMCTNSESLVSFKPGGLNGV